MRFLILLALVMIATAPTARAKRELLSIGGVALPEKGYIAGFKIDTWGVEVLAVCHLPPGWTITAGKSADPTGLLAGEASLGVAFLDRSALKQLSQMFLIELEGPYQEESKPIPNGEMPATFAGKILVGTYGPHEPDAREVPLKPANLLRQPADRCP